MWWTNFVSAVSQALERKRDKFYFGFDPENETERFSGECIRLTQPQDEWMFIWNAQCECSIYMVIVWARDCLVLYDENATTSWNICIRHESVCHMNRNVVVHQPQTQKANHMQTELARECSFLCLDKSEYLIQFGLHN